MSFSECWTRKTVTQRIGFIIASVVSLFWLWFGIASGLGEGQGIMGLVMHILMPGMLFLIPVIIALRWEAVAGGLMVAAAVFAIFFFHMWLKPEMFLICAGPLILGGLMLIPFRKLKTT